MSRSYNARRKARRRQARTEKDAASAPHFSPPHLLVALIPVAAIVAILAIVGILGFGGSSGTSRKQIQQEVATLLSGIPQHGTTLGSPDAPITLQVFADLECPTVKRFVTAFLPSIIENWVRTGHVKLEYRSLETDTYNEETFFQQEAAALAASRQNKMWNYALTFIHEQGKKGANYATDAFLTDVAVQVPGLDKAHWQRDRRDSLLPRQVAREVYMAHSRELKFTPSFLIGFGGPSKRTTASFGAKSVKKEVESSLSATINALVKEVSGDTPTLGSLGA
jgi:thioredoxin family protein